MVRVATNEDFASNLNEDYVAFAQQGTLTANKPTTVITRKIDTAEKVTITHLGTNGGYLVTLQLKDKNDQIGEDIRGEIAPFAPKDEWYKLTPPMTFEAGSTLNLIATASSQHTNAKFFLKGTKVDKTGL